MESELAKNQKKKVTTHRRTDARRESEGGKKQGIFIKIEFLMEFPDRY